MLVLEYKAYGKVEQFRAVDEAIRTAQFMLCHPARARELVRKGRAVRRFRKGFSTFGFCYIGGHMGGKLSPHTMQDGRRLTQNARRAGRVALVPCSWRVWIPKEGG